MARSIGGNLDSLLQLGIGGGDPGNPALLMLGANLLPSPVPVPGNPACNLYIDPLVFLSATFDPTGNTSHTLQVPRQPALRSASILSQWAALSSSGRIDTTQVWQTSFRGWLVFHVRDVGSNGNPSGVLGYYSASIVQLGI